LKPAVSPAQNGTGVPVEIETEFDPYGKVSFRRDGRGFVTAFSYDLATGAMIEKIEDADLTLIENAPVGWLTLETGGTHLITNYEVDDQGRTVKTLGPLHEAAIDDGTTAINIRTVQCTVYRDDQREVWTASGYVTGDSLNQRFVTVGPVSISRKDYAGRVTDQISSKRHCECGPLVIDEAFPQSCWTR